MGASALTSPLTLGRVLPGSYDGCVWETNCVADY